MKSLHLLKTNVGAEWALRQIRELQHLGIDCHVALPAGGRRTAQYREFGSEVHEVDLAFPVGEPHQITAALRRMRELVDEVRPDVIHSHFVSTTLTMRLALGREHRTPRLFQVPGPLHLESSFFRKLDIGSAGIPDHWIGSCRWTVARYIESGIRPDRVSLSYYGTDVDQFSLQFGGKLRSLVGVDSDVSLVGIVAYMYPPKRYLAQFRGIKGHEDLFQAIRIGRRTNPGLRLVVIGGAWGGAYRYEDKLRKLGRALLGDSIDFLGVRSDIARLYPDLDVAVHPSLSENVGGAVESLLSGVPTVTTAVGGFPDVVIPGRTGWLVPPRSPRRLASAIAEAVEQPDRARTYADSGRELARRMFDVRRTAREVVQIYERAVAMQAERSS